ncbi:unnamed protein product [Paramecium octaurelia]|uniref:Uncharacterized protein n=1 Tax=Paramecium octaurelia TaxID=43137 RepID=A0A8S1WYT0_PAROT|nr:unnamed protein product [Paramecium octaurelia]
MNQLQIEELQRKLQKLQLERLNEDSSDEEPTFQSVQGKLNDKQLFQNLSIDSFEVYTTLGTGTFGRVKQVRIKRDPSRQVYALKIMKKHDIIKLKQVDHIKSEKNILNEIQHPFLVQLKGSFQDAKCIYMLFEFVSGGELFSRLRKDGRFSQDITLFYVSQILLAIQHLHRKDIVYRDLKPENLLIDREGHIKIADFGFAKKIKNNHTQTLCGTPEYLAPELIQGAKTGYGKSIDWWALGVLIFEMLAGHPPFYDIEPTNIYKKILNGVIEFPKFLHVRAKDVIRKLLNSDVNKRLGVEDEGAALMNHKFFRGVPWQKVYEKKIQPPWIPFLRNETDSQWFDKYPEERDDIQPIDDEKQHMFDDF